jgi:hypothetical protein
MDHRVDVDEPEHDAWSLWSVGGDGWIDLGDDHWLKFFQWAPDRGLNPQWAGRPDVERAGAIVAHHRPDGTGCLSSIHFDTPETQGLFHDDSRWRVESWDPLTLSPSLLCNADKGGCGDHGFVRGGRWVRA